MPASAFTGTQALAFRGIDDTLAEKHLEGSECCLIHTDNHASTKDGVYLNPNVRAGHNSRDGRPWVDYYDIWLGPWKNRLHRWFTTPAFNEWTCRREQRAWESEILTPVVRRRGGSV